MLNQLHNNIYWTQRANFIDIPTDCPQRDERMGWTGDAQVYVRTATLEHRRAGLLHQVAGGPGRRPARRRPIPHASRPAWWPATTAARPGPTPA